MIAPATEDLSSVDVVVGTEETGGPGHASGDLVWKDGWLLSFLLHCLTFFAHWFGSQHFDVNGDGHFDMQDVRSYFEQRGVVHNTSPMRTSVVGSNTTTATRGAFSLQASLSAQSETVVPVDSTGTCSMEDAGSLAGTVEACVMRNVTKKHYWPRFVVVQCLASLALWLAFFGQSSLDGEDDAVLRPAGLDTFWPGSTDLRWSSWGCKDCRWEVWRWLTYQWSHANATHVLSNVALCILLGVPLEGFHGTLRITLMFNAGVLGGALSYFLTDAHSVVVGMSGGCFSLIGVQTASLLLNWRQTAYKRTTLAVILAIAALDLVSARLLMSEGISHSAHAGGSVAGFLMAVPLARNLRMESGEKVFIILIAILSVLIVVPSVAWVVVNEAPLNVFEVFQGEPGYCRFKQVFREDINKDDWECVRCGTRTCVSEWEREPIIKDVALEVCAERGWYYDER
eukprot:CAMPEP_0204249560 /NCGR_PEP_ID=MMETSP0361-20130328/99725_1 /ASSEMBLY_ACC=CAM_ASM_000343 /TAXON_ID=268821 /ORGANISM="Scrippsiella Hangoei, Strain SHTV-5" /LENGTH=454 /DNA_ID=CAMNT_0051222829 /DNA_START=110 /DNA_END=1474 /DNA_ORIENTATION=+